MPAMPPRPTHRPARRWLPCALTPALVPLALTALLGACGPQNDQFPPPCPGLALVPDAGDVTRFNGHGLDVTNLVVQGRITAVPAVCKNGDTRTTVVATLHVDADFSRGPAATEPPKIGYFIALMEADKVLREQDFAFTPSFGTNVNQTSVRGEDIEVVLPVTKTKSAAAYRVFVGFRLSPTEYAYNRTHAKQ